MPRLEVELVPQTCWWSNVRSQVTKTQWETCKRFVRTRSRDRCEVCGGRGMKWPVECHEIWNYDDENQIQTLVGLVALCPDCHAAKHIGRTLSVESSQRGEHVLRHIMTINRWGYEHLEQYLDKVFAIHSIRSEWVWSLDVSYLKTVGIELPQYAWGPKERVTT